MATYAVGQQLSNGATVVTDTVQTAMDGTTVEYMRDSAGNETTITTPAPGTPAANRQTVEQKALDALASNAAFLAINNPTAGQNATQIQALTKQCNGLIRLLLDQFDTAT